MEIQSGVQSQRLKGGLAFILSGILLLGICPSGIAQEEKEPLELEELVITGTKRERNLKDVPVKTEIITSQDLKDKEATTLYEALEGIPGIRVEQQCSYCNFSIVRMQGLESGHVQVLIDGQPIFSGLAGVYGLQQIPTVSIERIEIVKGAGSALYGSSAIAGVINIITKKPGKEPFLGFTSSFGTNNTNNYTLGASRRMGNIDMMLTAQKNTGGAIDQDKDGFTDRVKTDNLALGARINVYDLSGDDQFTFTGRTVNEMRQGGELTTWENPFAAGAESIKTGRCEAGAGYKKKFANEHEIGINLGYCVHSRSATNDAFLGDYEAMNDTFPLVDEMQPYLATENLYVVDLNYLLPIGEKHYLLGGVQYSYNRLIESGRYVIVDEDDADSGQAYTSESEKFANEVGVYLQDEFSITDALELVAGIRYDIHNSQDNFGGSGKAAPKDRAILKYSEQAFNPRLALRYRVFPEFTLRVSGGTGFRVPYGFSEDLHLCSGSPRVNKPAGLRPEKSLSVNIGADYGVGGWTLSANIFRTDLQDKIGFANASDESKKLGYTYDWENIGKAYTQGVELGSKVSLAPDLGLDLNLAYTDAQYENQRGDWVGHSVHGNKYAAASKYIPRVPGITGGIKLGYSPGTWNVVLDANYTGSMYIDYCKEDDVSDTESYIKHTEPFFVVNAKISKEFGQGITLFAGVKNLLDYVQPERHPDDAAFMYAPYTGRQIYGGVEVKL